MNPKNKGNCMSYVDAYAMLLLASICFGLIGFVMVLYSWISGGLQYWFGLGIIFLAFKWGDDASNQAKAIAAWF